MPGHGGGGTKTGKGRFVEGIPGILPPHSLILHNDDVNSMDFVVAALLKSVEPLGKEDAISIMLEAHNTGRAVVITCPLEHAELYRDRLRSFNLGVTIEKI
ncbi:MAG: ATP-dependent Clp protease adaptor ClpS [Chloroflexi bacterium]|nr:ATP-dependent Clp protease adaptor ClpS [Chloroflexota bacterium]